MHGRGRGSSRLGIQGAESRCWWGGERGNAGQRAMKRPLSFLSGGCLSACPRPARKRGRSENVPATKTKPPATAAVMACFSGIAARALQAMVEKCERSGGRGKQFFLIAWVSCEVLICDLVYYCTDYISIVQYCIHLSTEWLPATLSCHSTGESSQGTSARSIFPEGFHERPRR